MTRPRVFCTLVFAGSLAACGAEAPEPAAQSERATDAGAVFEHDDVLALELEQSPTGGADFDFCVSHDLGIQMRNASWLAFMAANEYAHFGYIGPMLNELGFYNPNDANRYDFAWAQCAADLSELNAIQKRHIGVVEQRRGNAAKMRELIGWFDEDLGSCAREWLGQYDGRGYPAGEFEKYLVQTNHPAHYVQFFSSGAYEFEGELFEQGSTQVMFARHSELPIAIVSFRGTEPDETHDLIADGKAWQVRLSKRGWPSHWGKAHAGFVEAFESVSASSAADKIRELEGSGVKIYITGHSLGGALATVMAARMVRAIDEGNDYTLGGVYTFGSPKVGNTAFADNLTARLHELGVPFVRFRNEDDIVTRVPGVILDYKHAGTLAYMTENEFRVAPLKTPQYGVGGAHDHSMVGFDDDDDPISGYYRRVIKHADGSSARPFLQCND